MVASKKPLVKTSTSKKAMSQTKAAHGRPHSDREAGEATVAVDRRAAHERRARPDRRGQSLPIAVERRVLERRVKVSRRRQIDPTTCERDYTSDEIEFMSALNEYKHTSGRMFPTCSEVLEVLRNLGYEKRPQIAPVATPLVDLPLGVATEQVVVG